MKSPEASELLLHAPKVHGSPLGPLKVTGLGAGGFGASEVLAYPPSVSGLGVSGLYQGYTEYLLFFKCLIFHEYRAVCNLRQSEFRTLRKA